MAAVSQARRAAGQKTQGTNPSNQQNQNRLQHVMVQASGENERQSVVTDMINKDRGSTRQALQLNNQQTSV